MNDSIRQRNSKTIRAVLDVEQNHLTSAMSFVGYVGYGDAHMELHTAADSQKTH